MTLWLVGYGVGRHSKNFQASRRNVHKSPTLGSVQINYINSGQEIRRQHTAKVVITFVFLVIKTKKLPHRKQIFYVSERNIENNVIGPIFCAKI